MGYAEQHMRESAEIIGKMDLAPIEKMADLLAMVKADGGRIFFLGVGGSAGKQVAENVNPVSTLGLIDLHLLGMQDSDYENLAAGARLHRNRPVLVGN